MHAILTVWVKEVFDNFRDRRTMLSALVFGPLIGPVLFVGMMKFMLANQLADANESLELPVIGSEYAPNLMQFLVQQNVDIKVLPKGTDAEKLVSEKEHPVVLIISEKFPRYFKEGLPAAVQIVADQSSQQTQKPYRQLQGILEGYKRKIAQMRLEARGISSVVVDPLIIEEVDVSTPAARAVMILGMLTYFLIFAVMMGGMYLAIDTTAGERERGSLESLLTVPVSRTNLVIGKLLATATYMAASTALTIFTIYISIRFIPFEKLGMVANFPWPVAIKSFLVMLPFALFAAGFMTVISSYSKSYKEAQSYLSMSMMLPTFPIIFAVISSLKPTLSAMAIPSLSQHLILTELIKGQSIDSMSIVISVLSTTLAGLLLSWFAIRRYHRESLLV